MLGCLGQDFELLVSLAQKLVDLLCITGFIDQAKEHELTKYHFQVINAKNVGQYQDTWQVLKQLRLIDIRQHMELKRTLSN